MSDRDIKAVHKVLDEVAPQMMPLAGCTVAEVVAYWAGLSVKDEDIYAAYEEAQKVADALYVQWEEVDNRKSIIRSSHFYEACRLSDAGEPWDHITVDAPPMSHALVPESMALLEELG